MDKVRSRYFKALQLLPQVVEIAEIVHIYDNTLEPFRIFKKRKNVYFYWENEFWKKDDIQRLAGVTF